MGTTSAAFGSRRQVDSAVDALIAAHWPTDAIRLVTTVDGRMTEVAMNYQSWLLVGGLVGGAMGALVGYATHPSAQVTSVTDHLWVTVAYLVVGMLAGALGGIGTWRMRFAALAGGSTHQFVVLVDSDEDRSGELRELFARHGGAQIPSDGHTVR